VPYTADLKLNKTWYDDNIVYMDLPYEMKIAWAPDTKIKRILVHKLVKDSLFSCLKKVYNHARILVKQEHGFDKDTDFYNKKTAELLDKLNLDNFGGTFNFRRIHGSKKLSLHSWGISIDLDPANNAQGDLTPAMPKWVVEIFEEEGWFWGGHWSGKKKDGMHFQFATGA